MSAWRSARRFFSLCRMMSTWTAAKTATATVDRPESHVINAPTFTGTRSDGTRDARLHRRVRGRVLLHATIGADKHLLAWRHLELHAQAGGFGLRNSLMQCADRLAYRL